MMRRRLFTIGRTEIYLHLATVLLVVYMLLLQQGRVLLISMVSILAHEAAHAVVAACMGKPPQEIEISPLGGMMRLEDETKLSPWQRLLMLLAGPAASLGLCWLSLRLTAACVVSIEVGRRMFASNLLFLAGNMLPALPMDGGRVISLLLSLRLRPETVRKIMRTTGTVIGFCLIVLNLILSLCSGGWNLSLSMTGCFLMYAAVHCTTTAALEELRTFMDRKIRLECKGVVECRWVTVTERLSLRKAVRQLSPSRYTMFVCVDAAGISPVRVLGESTLIAAYLADPSMDVGSVQGLEA